jgi:hypothetical protein
MEVVAIIALGRFSAKRNNLIFFIGSAFVGSAFMDGFYAIVTSQCTGSGRLGEGLGAGHGRCPGVLGVSVNAVDVDAQLAHRHPELEEGRYVCIAVSDTGYGMDNETIEKMFDPF